MYDTWEFLKRPMRNRLKQGKAWLRGYPLHYARQQNPEAADRYAYCWCESSTPIPNCGTVEIHQNRLWNLQLAARRIHYLRLNPGKIFGFCDRIGNPTHQNGFRAGPVFVRGQVQTGFGGGLCLIATNVFRTFLLAGCEILERHCHSIDAYGEDRFYTLGQDAAVAYGYKDLILRNSSAVPLQLRFEVRPEHGLVCSSLWGEEPCPWAVTVESTVLEQLPTPFPHGIPGWVVKTVRYVSNHTGDDTNLDSMISATCKGNKQPDYRATSVYEPCLDTFLERDALNYG